MSHGAPQHSTSAQTALDRFLADNRELEDLSARLETFNVFRALRIERTEIRHSNVLGWLLDPAQSHGLGDVVLRRVLSNLLLETGFQCGDISAARVELMDFTDIEVRREWRNIDILVVDRVNRLAVLVENKVMSRESPGQLRRYLQRVKLEFPGFTLMPVFLTLLGDDSSEEVADEYATYSYVQLLGVLDRIFEQRQGQLAEEVAVFLGQYLDTLRRLTMQDAKLAELCKTIYRKHREAIDLIVEYGMAGVGPQTAEDVLKARGEFEILYMGTNIIWFAPTSWLKVVPENGVVWKHLSRNVGVACWIEFRHSRVRIVFELSSMDDPALRLACARALDNAGFKLSKKAFDEGATYSRFQNYTIAVEDLSNEEEIRDVVEKLLQRAKDRFALARDVFEKVFAE